MTPDEAMSRLDGPAWPTTVTHFAAPLTIGVVSDTHVYHRGQRHLPREALDLFRRFSCGLLVHAGDVNIGDVLDQLAEIAPVLAVTGNNDDDELHERLPMRLEFSVGDHRFAVIHGHGGRSAREVARTSYAGRCDCVIYGHSHTPMIEEAQGTMLFNPGSATDRRWGEHFGIGIIQVTANRIAPELVLFRDPRHLANIDP